MGLIGDLLQVLHQRELAILTADIAEEVILVNFVRELVEEDFFLQGRIQVMQAE